MRYIPKLGKLALREQLGITGLETAIVLIAFVVVSSVFAFAALSTGLFTSDKSKETIQAGLGEAQGTLEVKGSLQLNATLTSQTDALTSGGGAKYSWTLTNTPVVPGSETMTSGDGTTTLTLGSGYTITYKTGVITTTHALSALTGEYQSYVIDSLDFNVANAAGGNAIDMSPGETIATYLDIDDQYTITNFGLTQLGSGDGDNFLEKREVFNVNIDTTTGDLINGDLFTVQIKPPAGAVINLTRRVPDQIQAVISLD